MSVADRIEQSFRDLATADDAFYDRQKKVTSLARLLGTLEFLEITVADHEQALASYLEAHERRMAMEDSWGEGPKAANASPSTM